MVSVIAAPAAATSELATAIDLLAGGDLQQQWQGWNGARFPAAWMLRDDTLTLEGPVDDGWHVNGGYLVSREKFGDFDLRFEFRTSPAANSGVMVRVVMPTPTQPVEVLPQPQPQPQPPSAWPWQSGTEYQILDPQAPHEPGALADRSADLYGLVAARGARPRVAGQWNQGRIVACGRRLRHFLNGRLVVDVDLDSVQFRNRVAASKFAVHPDFAKAASGHIALQDHGLPMAFRRLRLQPLAADCARALR